MYTKLIRMETQFQYSIVCFLKFIFYSVKLKTTIRFRVLVCFECTHISPSGHTAPYFFEIDGAANRVLFLIFVVVSNHPYKYFTILTALYWCIIFFVCGAIDIYVDFLHGIILLLLLSRLSYFYNSIM